MGCGSSSQNTSAVHFLPTEPNVPVPPSNHHVTEIRPLPSESQTPTFTSASSSRTASALSNKNRINSIFGRRQRVSEFSKRVAPQDLEFIEQRITTFTPPPLPLTAPRTSATSQTSADTQQTTASEPVAQTKIGLNRIESRSESSKSSSKLPPIKSTRRSFVARPIGTRLPNVVGTPSETSRPATGQQSVVPHTSISRLGRRPASPYSDHSEHEIIAHRRASSLDSVLTSPRLRKRSVSLQSSSPTVPTVPLKPFMDNSSMSDTDTYVFVKRKVKVAWQGRRQEPKPMNNGTATTSDSASCSTCEPTSSEATDKNTDSNLEETKQNSDLNEDKSNNAPQEDEQTERKTNSARRSKSALARLKEIRQFSFPGFPFGSRKNVDTSEPDLILPNVPIPCETRSRKMKFLRSRTVDFASIRRKNVKNESQSPSRRFDGLNKRSSGLIKSMSTDSGTAISDKADGVISSSDKPSPRLISSASTGIGTDSEEDNNPHQCATVHRDFFNDFEDIFDDPLVMGECANSITFCQSNWSGRL